MTGPGGSWGGSGGRRVLFAYGEVASLGNGRAPRSRACGIGGDGAEKRRRGATLPAVSLCVARARARGRNIGRRNSGSCNSRVRHGVARTSLERERGRRRGGNAPLSRPVACVPLFRSLAFFSPVDTCGCGAAHTLRHAQEVARGRGGRGVKRARNREEDEGKKTSLRTVACCPASFESVGLGCLGVDAKVVLRVWRRVDVCGVRLDRGGLDHKRRRRRRRNAGRQVAADEGTQRRGAIGQERGPRSSHPLSCCAAQKPTSHAAY